MGSVTRFAALSTKLDAIKGQLLDDRDYENLFSKDSVAEIARYLKENTHYSDLLDDVNVDDIHRGDLNLILSEKIVIIIEKLMHYTDSEYKDFMKALLMRYEVEDLKLILRGISRNEDLKSIKRLFIHSDKFSLLDFDKLVNVSSLEDMIGIVKDTPYQEAFRNITTEDLKIREFHAEMNLDFIYFRNLVKKASKLSKEDSEILKELIGTNIDLINLQWIYRAKKFYGLMPEEILNYTLPDGRKYNFKKLKELVYSDEPREAISNSVSKHYKDLLTEDDIYIERKIDQFLNDTFRKTDKYNSMNIAKMIAVIHYLEFEIRDIVTLIEAIRYEIKDENVKAFMIRNFWE